MDAEVWELFHPAIAPSDGDMHAYLERIIERCIPLFDASGASIFLEESPGIYKLQAQSGILPPIPAGSVVKAGQGIAGACLELGEPLLIKDVQAEIVFTGRQIQQRRDLGSAMVVPLIVPHGPVIGVLNVSRKTGEADFGQPDLAAAASLAHQVALAVSTGRLLAETKQAYEWLSGLMECVPAAVLALRPDNTIQEANIQGKELAENPPKWLGTDLPMGRTKIVDTEGELVWRVDCLPAGEGRVIIAEDITEQEQEAEQAERLRMLAEIGQMSATVAHEIRNPLTGIRAAVQMLLDAPDHSQELGEIIDHEVMRLSTLCEDFLDLARPTTLKKKPSKLSEIVMRVTKLEQAVADQSGVTLAVEGPHDTKEILLDPDRVEQVLRNLIRNAIQACEPGATCTLRYDRGKFEVEDTGSGMSAKTLQNLFVPFYTTKPQGTGLGLSTSRKIVEAHGGKLSVHSVLGQGTKFTVELGRAA
ncbi:MAG TPA: ATP-binding protein [Fimbriimonas sp.]|nr:ATP-binding protein [Fimbriimonas sp.]